MLMLDRIFGGSRFVLPRGLQMEKLDEQGDKLSHPIYDRGGRSDNGPQAWTHASNGLPVPGRAKRAPGQRPTDPAEHSRRLDEAPIKQSMGFLALLLTKLLPVAKQ
jgi:hypothetical protein